MKNGKRAHWTALGVLVVAVVAAVAFGATSGQAKAAPLPPVTDLIQSCTTEGGTQYITDGVPEEEPDCEATDDAIADPSGNDMFVQSLCIEGQTYLYADDDPADEFLSFLQDEGYAAADGACASPAPPPSNVFLCYSSSESTPGVWSAAQAPALIAAGYWSPYAIKGNVAGGTNVGGYHLVCNLVGQQSVTSTSVTTDGSPSGSDAVNAVKNQPGWYPVAG